MDPFAVLGLPRAFDVDLAAAERAHRDLSRTLHPDKFVASGPSERKIALGRAVEVNEAWRIVRDPISRAEALFRLAGVDVEQSERQLPPKQEFLMEMMELREELADAKRRRDSKKVEDLALAIHKRRVNAETHLDRILAPPMRCGFPLHQGIPHLVELRFYRRFLDEVSAIEDELAHGAA